MPPENCRDQPSVLWACMVHEPDARWLQKHLAAVFDQVATPDRVIVVDSGRSETISQIVASLKESRLDYLPLDQNLGFNPALNIAIDEAITSRFDWLATMTVRAKPEGDWLKQSLKAGIQSNVGMVTTLHLDPSGTIDCLGHNLGLQGQLYPFGVGLHKDQLQRLQKMSAECIWSPCSGGALYRTSALSAARSLIQGPLVRPLGFKSYNCDVLGYLLRAVGYVNSHATEAVCVRDRAGSSSRSPGTAGLLINQEINRIANLVEFWEPTIRRKAIGEYLTQDRRGSGLSPVDLVVARTLGEGLARLAIYPMAGASIQKDLVGHLDAFDTNKKAWKALLSEATP
jgi:hypothetical protein